VGSFAGGTFTSGAYQALEDLEGGLEDEGLGIVVGAGLLSPRSAAAAAVPLNPVLEELEPDEEPEKGGCTWYLFVYIFGMLVSV
jgi:hypothetical protein